MTGRRPVTMGSRTCALALCALALVGSTAVPAAAQCGAAAPLAEFTEASAMRAIFCAYDRERQGTLLPIQYTSPWNPQRAETLASPLLVTRYRERGVEHGLLVVQRQRVYEGEPSTGHAEGAVLSVYVFRHAGAVWINDLSVDSALEAGAYGLAPGAELFRIGPDRFGLWFEGGNMGQGYTSTHAHVLTLSDRPTAVVGSFDLGGSNSGTCSDDPKERNDSIHPCWAWQASADFIRVAGRDHYTLRLTFTGTDAPDINDPDQVAPRNGAVCYTMTAAGYTDARDPKCSSYRGIDRDEIFNAAEPTATKPALR